uniref:Uncharacterized protein n=1 Tax=Arundo donax TaxID=35708 RepID=A0A0A9BMJ5_ARUDO
MESGLARRNTLNVSSLKCSILFECGKSSHYAISSVNNKWKLNILMLATSQILT